MAHQIRVLIWNEFRHERNNPTVQELYPEGLHHAIGNYLAVQQDITVKTATLDEPEHGLSETILDNTDVLIWWGHVAHHEVHDDVVLRVQKRVLEGMGLIVLHSGHFSKIFKALMGTYCSLQWREVGEKERLWNIEPSHPITQGIGPYIELPNSEMYGERFDIPDPEKIIFISWFEGGEVFRSGCTWQRGHGRIFYFSPGHETYPIYHHEQILKVICNAVRWAYQQVRIPFACPNVEALEKITPK
jgi:trehalose utilization protein